MHNNPYRRRVTTQQLKARPRERERERETRELYCVATYKHAGAPRHLKPIINKRLLNIYG